MKRIEALRPMLPVKAALVTSPVSRFYLLGFSSSAGSLLILPDDWKLVIDGRYVEAATNALPTGHVILENDLWRQIEALCAERNITEVAIEEASVSVETFQNWQAATKVHLTEEGKLSHALSVLRMVKTPEELEAFRCAQRITDEAFAETLNYIRAGANTMEIRIRMGLEMAKRGCEKRSFDMILTSGPRTALPHGHPEITTLQDGDFVMMDVGAKFNGYSADMTRTVAVGHVTEEQEKVYATVLHAQQKAIDMLRPGVVCRDVDAAARKAIGDAGYQDCFNHGLGHSLGLEIHEQPRLNALCQTVLAPGMMTTVEPGIYLPGRFGVRIEDMGAVTESGFENMTHSEKNLLIL